MRRSGKSWSPETFDRLYAASPDPWRFDTSQYEIDKYAATLEALPDRRFAAAFEVGCSIGTFTRQLAHRCDYLLAIDVAEAAISTARNKCAATPWVEIERRQIPDEWPNGTFDLIVLSEVLYFLDAADIARTAARAVASLRKDGLVLLVNWTGPTDTPSTGDAASDLFEHAVWPHLQPFRRVAGATYRLDLLASSLE